MAESGILLIDKAADWTSHDVVAKLRGVLGTRRVGHAGTLDPMATGLLVIGVEQGTRFLTYLVGLDKTYRATIRLGQSTVTDDAEGELLSAASPESVVNVTETAIDAELAKLTGEIMQVPSSVSAIKVDGKRAYALVRGGDEVKLQARPVTISSFDRLAPLRSGVGFIDIDVDVTCSSGTYIRALARDLGAALGVGGHLTALRRTRVGRYSVDQASTLENTSVLPLAQAATEEFPTLELSEQQEIDLRHGKRIGSAVPSAPAIAGIREGRLVAMLEPAGKSLRSTAVFAISDAPAAKK